MDPQQEIPPQPAISPPHPTPPAPKTGCSKRYPKEERAAILQAFSARTASVVEFCAQHQVSYTTIHGWLKKNGKTRRGSKLKAKAALRKRFSPEERRQAVEAFAKAGQNARDFARAWGVSEHSLHLWLKRYRTDGPKGLEGRGGRRKGRKPVHGVIEREILSLKEKFPYFGLRKVQGFLARFKGLKTNRHQIRRVVKEAGLPETPLVRRIWRKAPLIRRFERSKPGELWQTDITSFNLARNSQRVFLVAFIDDNSRYVVAWKLAMKATTAIVSETLLEGIQRFGKPVEVLTDQGPQYYSWRGKSEFQKLLVKQGIKQAVARAHHPQTVGKCERFWKTVGEEFWARAEPQELIDAQERLGHFINHYNYFRPHQGIDNSVPADRFFGAESQVRKAIEETISANEIALALGEPTRRPVFLVGQIGDQSVTLHGEKGRLVISTEKGLMQSMEFNELGMAGKAREGIHDRGNRRSAAGTSDPQEEGAQAGHAEHEKDQLQDAQAAGAGEGVVGQRQPGGEGESAPDRGGADGILAGEDQPSGAGREDRAPAGESVAVEQAGPGWAGGGAVEAAQEGSQGGGLAGGRPQASEEEAGGGGETERNDGQPGECLEAVPGPAGSASEEGGGIHAGEDGQEGAAEGEKKAADHTCRGTAVAEPGCLGIPAEKAIEGGSLASLG